MFCVGVGQRTDACHRWHASGPVAVHGEGKETYGGCMGPSASFVCTVRCHSLNNHANLLNKQLLSDDKLWSAEESCLVECDAL
jgi:hypothetical protein